MKYVFLSVVCSVVLASFSSIADELNEKPAVPVGSAFIYKKSNLDGSNAAYIAVYYASHNELESFKWHAGNDHATIVRAAIDTGTTNVSRFEALSFRQDGSASLNGVMEQTSGNQYHIRFGDMEQVYTSKVPLWHSYDFDFASLGYAYRFIENIEAGYTFNVLDFDMAAAPPQFRDFGEVHITNGLEEKRWSRQVVRYDIDGAGLDNRGGQIWFDKEGKFLVAYQIEKPDERSYESGQLVLERIEVLDGQGWAKFKLAALGSS